jgi:hypothetical protein
MEDRHRANDVPVGGYFQESPGIFDRGTLGLMMTWVCATFI